MDNILSTSFDLRPDMNLEQIYQDCICVWLKKSKNYNFKELPQNLSTEKYWQQKFPSKRQTVEITYLSTDLHKSIGIELNYTNRSIKWITRVAIKKSVGKTVAFVSLQRECTESGISVPPATPPKIVALLMKLALADGSYDILDKAHTINPPDVEKSINIFKGKTRCKLPVIYISVSGKTHSLQPEKVAQQMRGLAHIVKESDSGVNVGIRSRIEKEIKFPQNGEIGVYFPNTKPKIIQRKDKAEWVKNPKAMTNYLFKILANHSLLVKFPYTWDTFRNDLDNYLKQQFKEKQKTLTDEKEQLQNKIKELKRQIEEQKKKIEDLENDNKTISEIYHEEEEKAKELQDSNQKLKTENDALKQNLDKKSQKKNIIEIERPTNLPEMFPDEFLLIMMLALKFYYANNAKKKSSSFANRPDDVIEALISPYKDKIQEYETHRDNILNASEKQQLKSINPKDLEYFNMTLEKRKNNHYCLKFKNGKDCYNASCGSTNSDKNRGFRNESTALAHAFLMKSK